MSSKDIDSQGLPPGVVITKSYNIFKKVAGNREVNEYNVRRIVRSMEKYGNLLAVNPIIVNENMEVIDGQHRLEAAKRLKADVAYTVRNGENIGAVVGLNAAATQWKLYDFAVSYADRGYEPYQALLRMMDRYKVPFGVLMTLATHTQGGGDKRHNERMAFQSGEFEFTNRDMVEQILGQYAELNKIVEPLGRSYDLALFQIMRNASYEHERMLEKYAKYGHFIKPQRTKADFINEIEDIYNFNARDRVRFY